MLTPEKLSAQKFDKVLIWGYDMNAVDSFLEQVEADYTALYHENDALTEKLKYLTGKVDEYRQVDEAMRKALLQAQNIADDTIARAKEESTRYKESVREGLMLELKDLTDRIQAEKERLEEARRVTRRYIDFTISRYASEEKTLSELRDREFSDIPSEKSAPESSEEPIPESVFAAPAVPVASASVTPVVSAAPAVSEKPSAAATSVSAFSDPIPTVSLSDDDLNLTKVFSSAVPKPAKDKALTEDTLTVPTPIFVADEEPETVPAVSESADTQTDSALKADKTAADVPTADEAVSVADIFTVKAKEAPESDPDPLSKSEGFLNPFWEDLWDTEDETKESAEASSEKQEASDSDEFTEDLNDDITLPAFNMSAAPRRKSAPAPKTEASFRFPKLTFGKSNQKSDAHHKPVKGKK